VGGGAFRYSLLIATAIALAVSHAVTSPSPDSRRRAGWRARSLSSFTPRRRSSGNGRAFGSFSGIPRLDSFWDAPVPVGVSLVRNASDRCLLAPVLELFDPPFGGISFWETSNASFLTIPWRFLDLLLVAFTFVNRDVTRNVAASLLCALFDMSLNGSRY